MLMTEGVLTKLAPPQRTSRAPLAGGHRGVVFLLRSDLDYLSKSLELQHASAAQPCCLCLADRSAGLNFLDWRPGAGWQCSVHTTPVWQRRFGSASQNPLRAPGITTMCHYPDVMHNKHLSMDAYFLGGILKVMLQYAPLPQIFEQCKAHWREARVATTSASCAKTCFWAGRLQYPYPKLKGKAAEVRSMTSALLLAWRRLREAHGLCSTYAGQGELGLQCSEDTHQSSPARVCAVAFAFAQARRPCQPARIDVILDEARGAELFFDDQNARAVCQSCTTTNYAAIQTALISTTGNKANACSTSQSKCATPSTGRF